MKTLRKIILLVAVLALLALCGNTWAVDDGLVAHWEFDEGGGTTAYDSAGSNHGTLVGNANWTTGLIGSAIIFDGDGDYIEIPDDDTLDITGHLTVSAWVNIGEFPTLPGDGCIVGKYDGEIRAECSYRIKLETDGRIAFGVSDDGGGFASGGEAFSSVLTADTWYHVVGVYIPSTSVKVYVNGVEDGDDTTSITSSIWTGSAPLGIGADGMGNDVSNALIDDVRIYDRALSSEEVRRLYLEGLGICPTGTALEFDGVDDYVQVPDDDSLDVVGDITISAWVYFNRGGDGSDGSEQVIVAKTVGRGAYNNPFDFRTDISSEPILILVRADASGHEAVYSTKHFSIKEWHHIAVTVNNNNADFYVDGDVTGKTGSLNKSASGNSKPFRIGRRDDGLYLDGIIDEVAIYDRALSAEEIRANMHQRLAGDEPGLVGYWDFDEGEGQIAYDLSGNGNDGRLGSTTNPDDSDPAWVESDAPIGICNNIALDIKPGSCPNPLNTKSKGVLAVAVLGSEEFDVTTIDVASIRLESIAPIRSSYEDVATPMEDGEECECTEDGPDGYMDLTLKFDTQEIAATLGEVNHKDELSLTLEGAIFEELGGTPIQGADCITIRGKFKPPNKADINGDGVVDFRDFNILSEQWLKSNRDK